MRAFTFSLHCTIFAGATAMLLASCAGTQSPSIPSANSLPDRNVKPLSYSVFYSFGAAPDGRNPIAGLIGLDGTLYGTTPNGGTHKCGVSRFEPGCGTVFSITTSGTEKVLHSFKEVDGRWPAAGLVDLKGTLYGTTPSDGAYGSGTLFSLTLGGVEKVLHSFGKGSDGSVPLAPLITVKGTLYGTTSSGGAHGVGTVFSITTSGTEKLLYSFKGHPDGAGPAAGLIDIGGTLYGTTVSGGAYECSSRYSKYVCGTVFSVTRSGKEKVLHSFGKRYDGARPYGGLIDMGDVLYGTTRNGGRYGSGTVFSITTGGVVKVLHSFGKGTDGIYPFAGLLDVGGTLYGTTYQGGAYTCGSSIACGTVFSITIGGDERVLHSFGHGTDGSYPEASLSDESGTLYGTTYFGGGGSCPAGCGTVFSLSAVTP